MQVFKFGGASVKDADAIKNVAEIAKHYKDEKLVIIVSAMGKTTNALESVVKAYCGQDGNEKECLQAVKDFHYQVAGELFGEEDHPVIHQCEHLFATIERMFGRIPADYNFVYDQIVSTGELLSTTLISAYLTEAGIKNKWMDVRDLIRTDNVYREANIQWETTRDRIGSIVPVMLKEQIVITQGFLGGTIENFTTTLGREGSDYTAAVFSNILDAEKMTVWKDVPGILNADPRLIRDAEKINNISYHEAVEMTYYGAKVIHPKTIKPLQNKNIPLYVRSFKTPHEGGTLIHDHNPENIPPVIVFNPNQILLNIRTKDFSFIAEKNLSHIYQILAKYHIKTNLSQNAAIQFYACIDDIPYKNDLLIAELNKTYEVNIENGLELLTIRHYSQTAIDRFTKDKSIRLIQKGKNTVQFLVDG